MAAQRTANTIKAYTLGWRQFTRWCANAGREPLPASSDTIQLFIVHCIDRGLRLHTVQSYLTGVTRKHLASSFSSPLDEHTQLLMQNAARELREKPQGKAALTPHHLRKICRRRRSGMPIDVRDRAMFVLGFASGWRGSEIASLNLADIKFCRRGVTVYLGASKTDQKGEGRVIGLRPGKWESTCPVHALRTWLKVRGDWPGALFVGFTGGSKRTMTHNRITRETVNDRLKSSLDGIGVDPNSFGSHSLRAGMVTAAVEAGFTVQQIKGRTGHKTTKTLEGYIRPAEVFRVDPLAGVL